MDPIKHGGTRFIALLATFLFLGATCGWVTGQTGSDQFAGRATIAGIDVVLTGSNDGATVEAGEPVGGGTVVPPFDHTVWWSWTAPRTGVLAVNSDGTEFGHVFSLFTGSSVSNLVVVHFAVSELAFAYPIAREFAVTAGARYEIALGGIEGQAGSFRLRLQFIDPPINDDFSNRIDLGSGEAAVQWAGLAVTREPEDHPSLQYSTWWTWTATNSGPVALNLVSGPPPPEDWNFTGLASPRIGVFTGSSLGSLSLVVPVSGQATGRRAPMAAGSFEAEAGTTYVICCDGQSGPNSQLRFRLSRTVAPEVVVAQPPAGASFIEGEPIVMGAEAVDPDGTAASVLFMAEGWSRGFGEKWVGQRPFRAELESLSPGGYELRARASDNQGIQADSSIVYFSVQPKNDNFDSSIAISGAPLSTNGSSYFATFEPGEPFTDSETGSAWWSWTATAARPHTLTMTALQGGPRFRVFKGSSITSLTLVAESTSIQTLGPARSRLRVDALSGETFRIATYGGVENLALSIAPGLAPEVHVVTPSGGSPFLAGETLTFLVNASDPDGQVDRVEFYDFSLKIGIATNAPFQLDLPLPESDHLRHHFLRAIAIDDSGLESSSESVSVTVNPRPPPNDAFANRIAFSGSVTSVVGTTAFATREPDEPPGFVGTAWWSWTAPVAGPTTIRSEYQAGFPGGPVFSVYSGQELKSLTLITNAPFEAPQITFTAEAGVAYAIAVGAGWEMKLSVVQTQPPVVNLISPLDWAEYVLPANLLLQAEATDPDGQIQKVEFFNDNGGPQFIGSTTSSPYSLNWVVTNEFLARGGGLSIRARAIDDQGVPASSSTVTVRFRLPGPPNDNFADRISLAGDQVTSSATHSWATMEPGEPFSGAPSVWFAWTPNSTGRATVQIDGPPLFQQQGSAKSLRVYRGTGLQDLVVVAEGLGGIGAGPRLPPQARFDAEAGIPYFIAIYADLSESSTSTLRLAVSTPPTVALTSPPEGARFLSGDPVTFEAAATDPGGQIVSVSFFVPQWASFGSQSVTQTPYRLTVPAPAFPNFITANALAIDNHGLVTLSAPITFQVDRRPAANDNFSERGPLNGSLIQLPVDLAPTTLEPGEFNPLAQAGDVGSAWWSWTPELSGQVTVSLSDTYPPIALGIYQGTSPTNLVALDLRILTNGAPALFVTASVEAGVVYAIAVHYTNPRFGDSRLTLFLDGRQILAPLSSPADGFGFEFRTTFDRPWIVEESGDLIGWNPLTTISSTNGLFRFRDPPERRFERRFYRVVEQPWGP